MSKIKYLWFIIFVTFPTAIFFNADDTKNAYADAFFSAACVAVITVVCILVYAIIKDVYTD